MNVQKTANHKASPICRECGKVIPYVEDSTIGFDLEPRLRGAKDISIISACEEFPEGCEPDKCSREIILTAEELHNWLVFAKKTHLNFFKKCNIESELKLIDLELLIDEIKKKLED